MKEVKSFKDTAKNRQSWRVVIVGTGGQGVLTAAKLLCNMFVARGHDVVSGQLHGMAQRGGAVQSSVMIDCGLSPVIGRGKADFVVGFEPVETARAMPMMSQNTIVFFNTTPVIPYILGQRFVLKEEGCNYPNIDELINSISKVTHYVFPFNATYLAQKAGSVQTLNMVLLGCLLSSGLLPASADDFWEIVARNIPAKLAQANAKAFRSGALAGEKFQPEEVKHEAQNWY